MHSNNGNTLKQEGTVSVIGHEQCQPLAEESLETVPAEPVSRFKPVPIRGEPLSETIIRERGVR